MLTPFGGKHAIDHGIANVAKRGRKGEGERGRREKSSASASPPLPFSHSPPLDPSVPLREVSS
jgi:hypothetical protein